MGDDAAGEERFDRLWREHAAAVLAYARRRVDGEQADEVVAETFVIAWRRLGDIPESARPWLFGVARKVAANLRRSERRRDALHDRLAGEQRTGVPETGDDGLAGRVSRATLAVRLHRARQRLRTAMKRLADDTAPRPATPRPAAIRAAVDTRRDVAARPGAPARRRTGLPGVLFAGPRRGRRIAVLAGLTVAAVSVSLGVTILGPGMHDRGEDRLITATVAADGTLSCDGNYEGHARPSADLLRATGGHPGRRRRSGRRRRRPGDPRRPPPASGR